MKFLITQDFFTDYELVEAPDQLSAEAYIIDCLNYNEPDQDIKLLGTSDTMSHDEAREQADTILYVTDYMTEE